MVVEITLNTMDEVVGLNNAACKYDGKLNVSAGSAIVDAKSLLALLALMGRNDIHLVAPDHENPEKFLSLLKAI